MAFYKRIKDLREDSDKTQKEIADYLGFSPNTIKTYLSRIYEKMNINKRDELKNYMLK